MSTLQEQKDFAAAIARFPPAQAVRGNQLLETALGPTRKRDMLVVGSVVDYDRTRLRIGVNWKTDRNVEYLAPRYLDPVEA